MRSRQLETALTEYIGDAALHLSRDTAAGAEVAFEIIAQPSRVHRTPLYCYRPLTGDFIGERVNTLSRLPSYGPAIGLLADLDGLDRYLSSRGITRVPPAGRKRAEATLRALLDDVFTEQTDFELHPARVTAALTRLQEGCAPGSDQVEVVATLHGLALAGPELALTRGLLLAQPDALSAAPAEAAAGDGGTHLLVSFTTDGLDADAATTQAREVLRDLLRALRLFGDGRLTLGALAWSRVGGGSWRAFVLGSGGRPRGTLVIAADQEDELRAFCNLVSRRAPHGNELAWALARFQMGCERVSDAEALTDYLLALRALLEPEGPASGLLAGRLAALCALPERRAALAERVAAAVALERSIVVGGAGEPAGADALVQAIAEHLRALLRDVICGHLEPDLHRVADELLAPPEEYDETWAEDEGPDAGEGCVAADAPHDLSEEATGIGPLPSGPGVWADAQAVQGLLPF